MKKPPLQDVIVRNGARPQRDTYYREHLPPRQPQADLAYQHPRREEMEYHHVRPHTEPPFAEDDLDEYELGGRKKGERKWLFAALGIGAVVVLSSVVLSLLFAGATVTVYPKQDTVVVDANFDAHVNGEGGALAFTRFEIERTASEAVEAQGENSVEERAKGTLTIYNEYSDTPQRLIKNTRFESTQGKIYRIRESVEVPGKKANGTPGEATVTVYAEEPGDSYNITGPESFTIPGFKGMPQEGKVYAKSTAEISGGFTGVKRTVNEQARAEAMERLETKLKSDLEQAAASSQDRPEGYLFFKEAVFYEFNPLPDEVAEGDKVTLRLTGKLHGVLFEEGAFAKRLAELTIGSYGGSPIQLDLGGSDLTVSLAVGSGQATTSPAASGESSTPSALWQAASYSVTAKGKAHFIWQFDEQQLARDLAGKDKKAVNVQGEGGMLAAYPGIDRLQANVRPFWKGTFPSDAKDIVIVTKLDE